MKHYQDVWINGKVVDRGMRECKYRYEDVIFPTLKSIKDRDKILNMVDIGAGSGYFSFRAAHDFPESSFTMIDYTDILEDAYNQNGYKNTKLIKKKMNMYDLKSHLEESSYNVILALNILHWYDDWEDVFNILTRNTKYIIIQTPYRNEITKNTTHNELLDFLEGHSRIELISEKPSRYEKDRPVFIYK